MMMQTTIQVETIGYYHQNANGTATPDLLPKTLNENRKYIEFPSLRIPFLNLNLEVLNSESGKEEQKLESLLNFIRQKGWPKGQKPDFVTKKELLTKIASSSESLEIYGFEAEEVTFLMENGKNETIQNNYNDVFCQYFTKNCEDEAIGAVENSERAVFKAKIPAGSNCFNILYTGNVEAIDGHLQHLQFEVLSSGLSTQDFWINKSCEVYWNSVFSTVPTIVIGTRTGKQNEDKKTIPPLGYPEFSIYKIEKLEGKEIPSKTSLFAQKPKSTFKAWTITDGETSLRSFLKLVKDNVTSNGDCFQFTRNSSHGWTVQRNEESESVAEFRDVVLQNIPV